MSIHNLDRRLHLRARGFTLPELLVVIVILGIVSAVGVQAFFFLVRRARVQSVALEVAGWIENVRNASADEVRADQNLGGCLVTFTPSASMAATDELAHLRDGACSTTIPENELSIPATVQQDTVTINSPSTVIFTPRGLWTDADGNPTAAFLMTITLDGGGPLRCVRLSPALGSVEIGRPGNSGGGECVNWQLL